MRRLYLFYFPPMYGTFRLLLAYGHRYRGLLKGTLQCTSLQDGPPACTGTLMVHLPVAWATCHQIHVTTGPPPSPLPFSSPIVIFSLLLPLFASPFTLIFKLWASPLGHINSTCEICLLFFFVTRNLPKTLRYHL